MSLAEKFQITVPFKKRPDKATEWQDVSTVRDNHGLTEADCGSKFNNLPPGMDIGDQNHVESFVKGFGGDQDVNGKLVNAEALGGKGYTRLGMKATDDQYSGEHIDLFYSEVKDEDGNVGCVERNNYLDRL